MRPIPKKTKALQAYASLHSIGPALFGDPTKRLPFLCFENRMMSRVEPTQDRRHLRKDILYPRRVMPRTGAGVSNANRVKNVAEGNNLNFGTSNTRWWSHQRCQAGVIPPALGSFLIDLLTHLEYLAKI
jgi:hypothetical protein